MDDDLNLSQARKDANPIIQVNHAHVVSKDHMPETNAQPKTLYVTDANERVISCYAAYLNQFLKFHKRVI